MTGRYWCCSFVKLVIYRCIIQKMKLYDSWEAVINGDVTLTWVLQPINYYKFLYYKRHEDVPFKES